MALIIDDPPKDRMSEVELATWGEIPTAVISDELNRGGAMTAAIKPLGPGMTFAGQALTVETMVGDNGALHYALTVVWPGAVIVVDAQGHVDTAVWGGVLNHAAGARGVAAVVIDGSVRDVAELRRGSLAVFSRSAVPGGPHKGWGGSINRTIQCGGVAVTAGDLVVGDDDGVVVVARENLAGLFERCRARMAKEDSFLARIDAGKTTVELLDLPPPETLG